MKTVVARGDARARGRQIGLGFADEINRSAAFYRRYIERRGVGARELEELLRPFVRAAEDVLPREVEALRATAEGADLPFLDLFAPNAFEELEPLLPRLPGEEPVATGRVERCTAFSVVGPGITLLGHDEQWLAGDAGLTGIVVEVPDGPDGIAIVSPTVASWRPAVGMNAAGGAVGVMSLTASDDGVGVPRVLVSRHALEAAGREDALRRAAIDGRSGGYAYSYAFRGGEAFTVETTATSATVIDGAGGHTNHYLDPELARIGSPPWEGTTGRLGRLRALLEEREPSTPQEMMTVLADHASEPTAICLHADPVVGEESDTVVFSMVCDLEAGRMWVAPGNPCQTPFEEIDLTDML